jgi:hypothetical protein
MSFIKRLWNNRGSRSREASIDSDDGGGVDGERRKNGCKASPHQSPSHKPPKPLTTTVGVKTPSNRNVAQVLPGLLLGECTSSIMHASKFKEAALRFRLLIKDNEWQPRRICGFWISVSPLCIGSPTCRATFTPHVRIAAARLSRSE